MTSDYRIEETMDGDYYYVYNIFSETQVCEGTIKDIQAWLWLKEKGFEINQQ